MVSIRTVFISRITAKGMLMLEYCFYFEFTVTRLN